MLQFVFLGALCAQAGAAQAARPVRPAALSSAPVCAEPAEFAEAADRIAVIAASLASAADRLKLPSGAALAGKPEETLREADSADSELAGLEHDSFFVAESVASLACPACAVSRDPADITARLEAAAIAAAADARLLAGLLRENRYPPGMAARANAVADNLIYASKAAAGLSKRCVRQAKPSLPPAEPRAE
ncbi:MAG: hypothetical protein PHW69_08030 [Elusimicrobiaceae bacterium]|nr:hypothetical protein [Elusimicrobiaceae bacterium]